MSQEKLNKIVDSVYKSTVSGLLKWSIRNSLFNSDTRHRYESMSDDGITKFYVEVCLKNDLTFDSRSSTYVNICNEKMLDKGAYIHSDKCPSIKLIEEWIYRNHIKPSIKISDQDSVMDDILNGIDISGNRDKKIDTILSSVKEKNDIKEEKNDAKVTSDDLKTKKSFFDKLFGK